MTFFLLWTSRCFKECW